MRAFFVMASPLLIVASPVAAQTVACANTPIDDVRAKYQPQMDQLTKDGDNIKHDAVALDGNVGWKDQEFIFDTPTATMKTQTIVVGVPQVTMKMQHIIFDTPSTRMVPKKVGQYPEWHGLWHVEWHDIITNVPEVFMQRQDIETKVPEFRWDNTTIKFDLPEFTMQRQRIVMGLPQFTITSIAINSGKVQSESETLKDKAAALEKAEGVDLVTAMHTVFSCQRAGLASQQAAADKQFDDGITSLSVNIDDLASKGVDPTKVSDGQGNTVDMRSLLADLVQKRKDADKSFKDAADQLDSSEKEAVLQASGNVATA